MMTKLSLLTGALTAPVLAGLAGAPAAAAIQCDGNYQIVRGQPISTPYCRDTYLAAVANQYGIRVSAHEVRWNPSTKQKVCAAIGNDIRVREACLGYRPEDNGRRPFLP